MGLGGISRYLGAWMTADTVEKDRLLQLMKDSVGMARDIRQMEQTGQQMEQTGQQMDFAEQRFPVELRTAEAVRDTTMTGAETAKRVEAGQVEAEGTVRGEFGVGPEALKAEKEAAYNKQATEIIRSLSNMEFVDLTALKEVTEILTQMQLNRELDLGSSERIRAQIPKQKAKTEKAVLKKDEAVAITGEEIAISERNLIELRQKAQMGQLTGQEAEGYLRAEMAEERRKIVEDVVADELSYKQLINNEIYEKTLMMQEQRNQLLTGVGQDLTAAQMEFIAVRTAYIAKHGFDGWQEFLVRKTRVEAGHAMSQGSLIQDIGDIEKAIAQIEVSTSKGEYDLTIAAMIVSKFDGFASRLEEGDELDPLKVTQKLYEHQRFLKVLLKKDWDVDYDQVQIESWSQRTWSVEDINDLTLRLATGEAAGGSYGNLSQQYGSGVSGDKKADVTSYLFRLFNDPKGHPLMWARTINEHRFNARNSEGEPIRSLQESWGQQNYLAAEALVWFAQTIALAGDRPSIAKEKSGGKNELPAQ